MRIYKLIFAAISLCFVLYAMWCGVRQISTVCRTHVPIIHRDRSHKTHLDILGSLRLSHRFVEQKHVHLTVAESVWWPLAAAATILAICSRCSHLTHPISFYDSRNGFFLCLLDDRARVCVCVCVSFSISSQIKLGGPMCCLTIMWYD